VLVKAEGGAPTVRQLEALGRRLTLFGTDFHSVDPMDSKTLDAHRALWRMGAVILEELDLAAVPDGRHDLKALPLKLIGLGAAPVRAVLIARWVAAGHDRSAWYRSTTNPAVPAARRPPRGSCRTPAHPPPCGRRA